MTVLSIFSYGFLAFGPMIALFFTTVARNSHEIIIMMSSAFFWLLSIFFTSIIWIIVPPLKNQPAFALVFSVLLQELFRWLLYKLLRRADKVLEVVSSDNTPRRKHKIAYVSGLGFGIISAIILFSNVLRESGGPAIVGVDRPNSEYFVLTAALGANVLVALHICWSVLWFSGLDDIRTKGTEALGFRNLLNVLKLFVVVFTHMFISCISLLNKSHSPVYFLLASHICAVVLAGFALVSAGAKPANMRHFFKL